MMAEAAPLPNPLLVFFSTRRSLIIHLFQFGYLLTALFVLRSAWLQIYHERGLGVTSFVAIWIGKFSLLSFIAATLPGILGRFKLKHPLISIGVMFRRHLGISAFIFGLSHALMIYLIPVFVARLSFLPLIPFVAMGLIALFLMMFLFLTSNDQSVKALGPWWKRIHRMVYIIYWFTFLHVVLQKIGIWTLLIGGAAVLEVVSLIYDWYLKRLAKVTTLK